MKHERSAAYERVRAARSKNRYTGMDFIHNIFTDFMEMHGDRRFADDPAVVGGLGYLDGVPVTVIATEKGRDTKSRLRRNFGAPNPEGYRKALRLMKQAEKFGRPVVCFVDTSGAFCGIGAEERGQGQAIAESISEMMVLRTPILAILIGEGGSGGALALAAADEVWMLENAVYSVISPESCANILWRDPGRAAEAAESLKLTARDALRLGVIERVVAEHSREPSLVFGALRGDVAAWYDSVASIPADALTRGRYARFRKLGVTNENSLA